MPQLLRHLPDPPATVLDVGGVAAHQSLQRSCLQLAQVLGTIAEVAENARQLIVANPTVVTSPAGVGR